MDIRKCEICGRQFIAGYGYSLSINWIVTGHAHVPAFLCWNVPGGQHWGCCPEHAMQAAQNCMLHHMHVGELLRRHEEHASNHRNKLLAPLIQQYHIKLQNEEDVTELSQEMIRIHNMDVPRYADDDAHWAKDKGAEFHLVEVKGGPL